MLNVIASTLITLSTTPSASAPQGQCVVHESTVIECAGVKMPEVARVFTSVPGGWTFTIISPERCKAQSSFRLGLEDRIDFLKRAAGGEYPLIQLSEDAPLRSVLITCLR